MNSIKVHFPSLALLALLVGATLSGCGRGDSQPAETVDDRHGTEPVTQDFVTVSREGSRFDPAVTTARIPEGAWMCEMGAVHYAALDQGDGKCPVCGMRLKQRTQQQGETADGHDHEHH